MNFRSFAGYSRKDRNRMAQQYAGLRNSRTAALKKQINRTFLTPKRKAFSFSTTIYHRLSFKDTY